MGIGQLRAGKRARGTRSHSSILKEILLLDGDSVLKQKGTILVLERITFVVFLLVLDVIHKGVLVGPTARNSCMEAAKQAQATGK